VQRVIQSKPAFICCAKNRHKYCDLNCACCVEPAIPLQGKSQAALYIMDGYRNCSRLPFASQSFQFFIESAGDIYA
jgi:hypothetical protein